MFKECSEENFNISEMVVLTETRRYDCKCENSYGNLHIILMTTMLKYRLKSYFYFSIGPMLSNNKNFELEYVTIKS